MELVQNWPIAASDSAGKRFRQSVPRWAPAGSYTYIGYVGEYPDTKLDSSYFTFEKLPGSGHGSNLRTSWELLPCEAYGQETSLPKEFSLSQNYPNPFNSSTAIRCGLPQACYVTIEIYDLLGRKVETLIDQEQQAGYHQITWDAEDKTSGVYFYKIQAGEYTQTMRMMLVK